ncbi:MAG TPA: hypothetical protein VFZ79_07380 [Acidimicrobiales bacterium]
MPHPVRQVVPATALGTVLALAAVAGACGGRPRDGLGADEARFTYGDRSVMVSLTACGRDGDVVVLAGAEGSIVVQARADVGDGGLERTGVTADLGGDGILGAFGQATELGPAGEISAVRVEGDRLVVEGAWVPFDEQLTPQPSATADPIEGELVARCPAPDEDETAAARRSPARVPAAGSGASAPVPAAARVGG